MVRGSKPVSPDQVPVPSLTISNLNTHRAQNAMPNRPKGCDHHGENPAASSNRKRHRTVEDLGLRATEGGDRHDALALDLAIAEKLHGGAGSGRGRAACTRGILSTRAVERANRQRQRKRAMQAHKGRHWAGLGCKRARLTLHTGTREHGGRREGRRRGGAGEKDGNTAHHGWDTCKISCFAEFVPSREPRRRHWCLEDS